MVKLKRIRKPKVVTGVPSWCRIVRESGDAYNQATLVAARP